MQREDVKGIAVLEEFQRISLEFQKLWTKKAMLKKWPNEQGTGVKTEHGFFSRL